MYIPKSFIITDKEEIVALMKQFSFATLITANNNIPAATHLPFTLTARGDELILSSHFARANNQWQDILNTKLLVIFQGPHAYISPSHYERDLSVPTWDYIAVHAYGHARIVTETVEIFDMLEAMISSYDKEYTQQWEKLPQEFKSKMLKGIVPFEITITELQASKKLSQNKTTSEQQRIIQSLSKSTDSNEQGIAAYMQQNLNKE